MMDVKSLYTGTPHRDGLEDLKFFYNKRSLLEPPTTTSIGLADLVFITLNNFAFDGEHYQQISGVAMGTKMGPSYANLFFMLNNILIWFRVNLDLIWCKRRRR